MRILQRQHLGVSTTSPSAIVMAPSAIVGADFARLSSGVIVKADALVAPASQPLASHLEDMLVSRRISHQDYDKLVELFHIRSAFSASATPIIREMMTTPPIARLVIPGNITLALPSYGAVEVTSRVINTPELLAMILALLPRGDLLHRIPLVCTGFKESVDKSPIIGRELYRATADKDKSTPKSEIKFVPFLAIRLSASLRFELKHQPDQSPPLTLMGVYVDERGLSIRTRQSKTLRKTFVSRPPPDLMHIEACCSDTAHFENQALCDPKGIRFGQVFDKFEEIRFKCASARTLQGYGTCIHPVKFYRRWYGSD